MIMWCASAHGSKCLPTFAYRSPQYKQIREMGNTSETLTEMEMFVKLLNYKIIEPLFLPPSCPHYRRASPLAALTKGTKSGEYAIWKCFHSTGTGFAHFCHPVLSPPTRATRSNKYLSGSRLYIALSCAKARRWVGSMEKDGARSQPSRCLEKSQVLIQEELNR